MTYLPSPIGVNVLIRSDGYGGTTGVGSNEIVGMGGIVGSSTSPTLTMGSASGLGASASIIGTNISGKITLTTGASLLSSGKVLSLTFAGGLTYPGGCVINFSAGDSNFANILTKLYASTNVNGADLFISSNLLSIATTYTGYYFVTGW